ncbi:hypothetical protein Pint_18066 [Pistacia integerrima]|uniref:Uncharacterized protein n=1 Tax=Pistacia integerrima TaxID=434235 RepID=A0ACC0YZL2_9ROSI|nr:hypothetical protein Pint_18066 [Pistacia integerrima]
MTFSLLVLHMWFVLRYLKEEGKEGVELGQYLYEIYKHDVELRVSKAGAVTWVIARGPWVRNIFSDDGTSKPDDAALYSTLLLSLCLSSLLDASHIITVSFSSLRAMTRYVRREFSCLSLTVHWAGKEAIFSRNFMFTPLEITGSSPLRK